MDTDTNAVIIPTCSSTADEFVLKVAVDGHLPLRFYNNNIYSFYHPITVAAIVLYFSIIITVTLTALVCFKYHSERSACNDPTLEFSVIITAKTALTTPPVAAVSQLLSALY